MNQTIRAVGIVWFRREDYARARKIFKDGHKLPATFDQWLKRAKLTEHNIKRDGSIAERAYIDPDTFPAWCSTRGLNIDASVRMEFANAFVAGKYRQTH